MLYFFLFLMLKFNINRMGKHKFPLFEHCRLNDLKISSCVLYDGNIKSYLGMLNINHEKITNYFFLYSEFWTIQLVDWIFPCGTWDVYLKIFPGEYWCNAAQVSSTVCGGHLRSLVFITLWTCGDVRLYWSSTITTWIAILLYILCFRLSSTRCSSNMNQG